MARRLGIPGQLAARGSRLPGLWSKNRRRNDLRTDIVEIEIYARGAHLGQPLLDPIGLRGRSPHLSGWPVQAMQMKAL
jgi:hypothetical protein